MKKNIVALAVASAIAAPVAMADAPTVYGQVNMAVEQYSVKDAQGNNDKKNSGTQINSRASRLGVKGSSDLGNGLKAVYKLEFQVNIDSSGDSLTARNQYAGLAGGFGTVLAGRHDTPLKMSQPSDLFNDAKLSDLKPMSGGLGVNKAGGEVRAQQTLAYVSPSFGGVKLVAAFVPKETGGDATKESNLGNAMSFAAMYGSKKKGLYLAGAYNAWDADMLGESANEWRLSAQYRIAGLIANLMYQQFEGNALKGTAQKGNNIQANVGYKFGDFMPKVKLSQVDRDKDSNDKDYKDSFNYAVGLDYALGKKTTAYVEYAYLEHQGLDGSPTTYSEKAEDSAFSIGLLHKF